MAARSSKKLIKPEDLFRFRYLMQAAFSPDGTQAIYSVFSTDMKKEDDFITLYLLDLKTGQSRQLTNGLQRDTSPAWSPDGKTIAFLSKRGKKAQLYLLPAEGGEARQLTSFEQGVGSGPVWSPDATRIAFSAPAKSQIDVKKPYRVDRNYFRFDAIGNLDNASHDIYVINVADGEVKQLTCDREMNTRPRWSPDGKEILYVAMMSPDEFSMDGKLRVVTLAGKMRDLTSKWGAANAGEWHPDGKQVIFLGHVAGLPIGSKNDLWVMPAKGGKPVNRSAGYLVGVGMGTRGEYPSDMSIPLFVSKDGKLAYVGAQDAGTEVVLSVALSGDEKVTPLVTGDRSCTLLDVSDKQLLFSVANFNQPPELHISGLDGKKEKGLTNLNTELLDEFNLPEVKHLLFKSVDGEQVEGWISLPPKGKAPYPTILYIHGGPHSGFGANFALDTQMLTGAGYAVLYVNHRASTGYGDKFSTAIKGDWGNLDYQDLMYGVDYAIAKGYADPDKLGCCGLSGGGNLSCWIVGHTDRFKAAVPENPVTNWQSFYGVSDIGVRFAVEELGGHPHEIPEIYAKCSPITYAHRCTTPTLMVQGEEDYRCPAEQSEQFYAVLKANGCTVEMVRLPGSPHGGSINGLLAVRKAQNDALLGWMNKYVLGKPSEFS